jgi:hypothetical protein
VARANRDRHAATLTDNLAEAERGRRLCAAQESEDCVHEAGTDGAENKAHERRWAGRQVEQPRPKEPADAEHRHEAQQQRHEGDATQVEPQVKEVEHAAQDVVQKHRDQQQDAAHRQAHDEDGLGQVDCDH